MRRKHQEFFVSSIHAVIYYAIFELFDYAHQILDRVVHS